ncbi:hypothetical protein EXN22_13025 [Pseudomonas tructae]|uniref:Uncharacterized protein n=1 Tax=Pseudomonas tructae TaxID=2518644 RepID=A0A411MIN4_9PSED|nr:hypothetical protein [Pseudomonas tructae]QBF26570.1 hypothetical protein EXN22_13025 [Pseudomonas tructae]
MKKKGCLLDGARWRAISLLIGFFLKFSGFVGLISIFDDLKAWKAFWDTSIAWVGSVSLSLAVILEKIPQAIHSIAVTWRSVLHPIVDFLTGWLPFAVPATLKDLILLGVFLAVGRRRARKIWSNSYALKQEKINFLMYKYLKVPINPFISYSKVDVRDFLLAKTADPTILTPQHERLLSRFDKHFGEDAAVFAYAVLNDPGVEMAERDQLPALNMSDKGRLVTHCVVGFFVALLLIDYIYFSSGC